MSNNENQIEENVNEKNKDEHFLPKGYVVKVTAKNKKFIEGPPEQLKKQRKSVKIFDKQQLSSLHSNGRHLLLNEKHFERLKHVMKINFSMTDFFHKCSVLVSVMLLSHLVSVVAATQCLRKWQTTVPRLSLIQLLTWLNENQVHR